MIDICARCGAAVIFVPSLDTGTPMILNAKPEKRAVLVHSDSGTLCSSPQPPHTRATVEDVYLDHSEEHR